MKARITKYKPNDIISAAATVFGVTKEKVYRGRQETEYLPNPARDVAMALCQHLTGQLLRQLAPIFQCGQPSLSKAKYRVSLRVASDPEFARQVSTVIKSLKNNQKFTCAE